MRELLRGDPGRLSLGELRAAVEAGARASAAFVARLGTDPRAGARALAHRLRRIADARARAEEMLALERAHWGRGVRLVAGVDEAGMGPLAGPIVAAAVVLSPDGPIPDAMDSKALTASQREALLVEIRASAVAIGVGVAEVAEIAALDVYQAGLNAMRRAAQALSPAPELLLVDARTVPGVPWPQEAHVRGDARSRSIAAASIVAKVERDAVMARIARAHPGYGFERHAGYATPQHLEALRRLGPCPEHRTSWIALAEHAGSMSPAFYELRDELRAAGDVDSLDRWRAASSRLGASLAPAEARRLDGLARKRARELAARRRPSAESDLPF